MKVMLLRVGIDKGVWPNRASDLTYGPIFGDGTFEFVPKSEETRYPKSELPHKKWHNYETYGEIIGRTGKPLSAYLPEKIRKRHPHSDPEFETFTYGDPTPIKRQFLLKLVKNDMLVFYAGLEPFKNDKYDSALYFVGYFTTKEVIDFNEIPPAEVQEYFRRYPNNAHIERKLGTRDLVIVAGNKSKSRLLDKAIRISQRKPDRTGRLYHAVSREMEKLLGLKGFIQVSRPLIIEKEDYIRNLKNILLE